MTRRRLSTFLRQQKQLESPMYRIRFVNTTHHSDSSSASRCGSFFKIPLRIIPRRTNDEEKDGSGHSFVDVTGENLELLCDALPLLSYLLTQDSKTKRKKRVETDKQVAELYMDPALGVSKTQFQKLMAMCLNVGNSTMDDSCIEEVRDTAAKLGGCRLFRAGDDNSDSYQPFVDDRSNEANWSLVGKLSLDMGTIPENGVV